MWRSLKEAALSVDKALGFPWLRRQALVGDIDNKIFVDGAEVNDAKIGKSMSFPMAQEIVVDKERSAPAGVGKMVDKVFFPNEGKLVFNVAFSCGKASPWGPGVYGDPKSIWFNVFFGYYEIDVKKREWGRPFGYKSDGKTVEWDDVLKIGKSDWNYFSNWVYGVPDKFIRPTNGLVDPDCITRLHPRQTVGARQFDLLEIDGAQVVTAYVAEKGAQLIDEDHLFSPLWRVAFGKPRSRPEFTTSFFPARMKAKLYMCFREVAHDEDLGEAAYQTFLFGGTINKSWPDAAENERFLELQLEAVRKVMTKSYSDVGFIP
jgi:hypothetical protein